MVLGWAMVPQAGSMIAGGLLLGLVTGFSAQYMLMAALPLLIMLFAATMKDPPLPRRQRDPFSLRTFLDGYRINPREHPDFVWAMSSRFIMGLGYGMGTLYLPYFLDDVLHYEQLFPGQSTEDGLLIVIGVNCLATISTVVLSGWLSDMLGKRRMLVFLGGVTMAVAAVPLALSPTWTMTLVAAVILGLGYGVYLAVDTALVTEVLPASADRGKDMALANLMTSLPYVLVPPIASVVLGSPGDTARCSSAPRSCPRWARYWSGRSRPSASTQEDGGVLRQIQGITRRGVQQHPGGSSHSCLRPRSTP